MIKKLSILIIAFLFLIPSVISIQNYTEAGNFDSLFNNNDGKFGTVGLSDSFNSAVLAGGRKHVLVGDLDNDGVNEIIAFEGATVSLFRDKELTPVDNFVLPANERLSNPILFDIDGDNLLEIIVFMEESKLMQILEFNQSNLFNQTSYLFNDTAVTDAQSMIKCGAVNDCLMAYTKEIDQTTVPFLRVQQFDSTAFGDMTELASSASSGFGYCFPKIRAMSYKDFENDGNNEFIFSAIFLRGSGQNPILFVRAIDTNSGFPILDYSIVDTISNPINPSFPNALCESQGYGRFITAPLVEDLNNGGADEIVVGHMVDPDEFEMTAYDSTTCNANDACQLANFPLIFTAQGELISNVVLADVFGDTGKIDFCVSGHDDENEELDLLCSSLKTDLPLLSQSREFKFSTDGQYNLSQTYDNLEIIMHEGQYVDIDVNIGSTGLKDTSEFVNSYGVFRLEDTTFNGSTFVRTLTRIFENERGQSSLVPVDAEKFGFNDLIAVSSTNIFYIDDGLSSGGARFDNIIFDPCPDGNFIKVNQTMDITAVVSDTNPAGLSQDNINVTMIVYDNDGNIQKQDFNNTPSGATIQSVNFFKINKTIVDGEILLTAVDSSNPNDVATFDKTLDVAINGVEKGDVTCEFDLISVAVIAGEEVIEEGTLTIDATENSVVTGVGTLTDISGLAGTSVWLIIMLAFSIFMWFQGASQGWNGSSTLGAIAIIDTLFIVTGARLGILSTSLVVIITLIGVIILGVFLGRLLTGLRGAEA